MTQQAPFNPNEHLMKLGKGDNAKEYLPVQWRLVWFREQCPEGTIETEMLHLDLDRETSEETFVWNNEKRRSEKIIKQANGFVLFKATVKDGKGGVATGTKSEKAASFPDYIEKAETGAIGRALAALGYGTQFAPELSEEHRIVDSPVDREGGTDGGTTQAAQQSDQLKQLIGKAKNRAVALKLATDTATWLALIRKVTGIPTLEEKDLTITHIGKLNGHMTQVERESKTPAGAAK